MHGIKRRKFVEQILVVSCVCVCERVCVRVEERIDDYVFRSSGPETKFVLSTLLIFIQILCWSLGLLKYPLYMYEYHRV